MSPIRINAYKGTSIIMWQYSTLTFGTPTQLMDNQPKWIPRIIQLFRYIVYTELLPTGHLRLHDHQCMCLVHVYFYSNTKLNNAIYLSNTRYNVHVKLYPPPLRPVLLSFHHLFGRFATIIFGSCTPYALILPLHSHYRNQ